MGGIEVTLRIRTPDGMAEGVEKKLKSFILGSHRPKALYINKDNNEIVWVVEGPYRKIIRIYKGVSAFDALVQGVLGSKFVKKIAKKHMASGEFRKMTDMLLNHTTVEIIKDPSFEEKIQLEKGMWTRIKEKIKSNKIKK